MDDILGSTFSCSTNQYQPDEAKIIAITRFLCNHLGLPDYEVSVSLVSRDEIQELNREHRGKDKPTDVLSFPQEEFAAPVPLVDSFSGETVPNDGPPKILGDIIICLDVAKENAQEIGQSLDREVAFLLVHGILHLCGYDHENADDEAVMIKAQKQMMAWLETGSQSPLLGNPALIEMSSPGVSPC